MRTGQAILLGALQGATEFLPVSSSGHLFLAERLLGFRERELAFDLLLHLATLLAVLFFLRRELLEVVGSLLLRRKRRFARDEAPWGRRDILLLVLSTIPTVVIGYVFRREVESGIGVLGVGLRYLFLTSFLLVSGGLRIRHKRDPERIEAWEALAIGIMQGAAVFPGLSRSGSTICLALVLGIDASRSAKFSFFISVPAILGAHLLESVDGVSVLPGALPSAAGFLAALLVGYASLFAVERLVVRGRFSRFAPYTFAVALLCFYLYARG